MKFLLACGLLLLGLLLGALGFVGRFDGGGVGVGELLAAFAVEGGANANIDGEALARVAFVDAADGSDIAIVAAVGDADVAQSDGISERGIKADPSCVRSENFGPCVRGLAADDFFLLGVGFGGAARDEIAGNVARGKSAHADDAEEQVREILADSGAKGEGIDNGGIHASGAFHVTETIVDQIGGGLGESENTAIG